MSKKVAVILVPGTWETKWSEGKPDTESPVGMLKILADKLDGDQYIAASIKYWAKFGDPEDYQASLANCKQQIRKVISALPEGTPFILVGYSQGAHAAGDIALEWWRQSAYPEELLALYNIADPKRNQGDLVGPQVEGCGILGQRGHMFNHPVYEFCAPGDMIASSDRELELSYLIAPFAIETGLGDPLGWARRALMLAQNRKELRKIDLGRFAGIRGAIRLARMAVQTQRVLIHYIESNVHARYANNRYLANKQTAIEWIADSMNRLDYMLAQERLNIKPMEEL